MQRRWLIDVRGVPSVRKSAWKGHRSLLLNGVILQRYIVDLKTRFSKFFFWRWSLIAQKSISISIFNAVIVNTLSAVSLFRKQLSSLLYRGWLEWLIDCHILSSINSLSKMRSLTLASSKGQMPFWLIELLFEIFNTYVWFTSGRVKENVHSLMLFLKLVFIC